MKITVLGAGAYGCALAQILSENKNEVTIWTPFEEEVKTLKEERQTPKLPNVTIYNDIQITTDLEKALENSKLIVEAIPTAFLSSRIKEVKKYYKNTPICIATKEKKKKTNLFVYDVVKNILKTDKIAVKKVAKTSTAATKNAKFLFMSNLILQKFFFIIVDNLFKKTGFTPAFCAARSTCIIRLQKA